MAVCGMRLSIEKKSMVKREEKKLWKIKQNIKTSTYA